MSALLNVNREVEDEFFRYKMPRLVAKIEGKGNGIKTVLVNMSDIAKSLYRQPTFPTKYFGCELGAQTQFDIKHDRYIVNGQHDAAKLQDLLDGFIRKFVLCANCHNPETDLLVKPRKNEVHAKCKACGHVYAIDPLHRLTTFILKNPPDGKKNAKKIAATSMANKTKGDSPERKEAMPVTHEPVDVNGSNAPVDDPVVVDDDWGSDYEEVEMVAEQQLSDAVKNMVLDVDVAEKSIEERANLFHAFLKQLLSRNQVIGHEKEIVAEADRMDIRDKAVVILLEVLLADPKSYLDQIRRYRKAFLHFTLENDRAQRHLLGALEKLIGEHQSFYLPRVNKLLLELYESDILSEEAILDWSDKGPTKRYVDRVLSKHIHDNAAKVVEWLRTASDDEDDSDVEKDEDEHVVNLQKEDLNGADQPKILAFNGGNVVANESGHDSDIDIDDI